MLRDSAVEIVNCASNDLRKENPDYVVQKEYEATPEKLDAVVVQVRFEWIELLEHVQFY